MTTIDDFIEAERARMGWWNRILGLSPDVKPTGFYAAYAGKPRLGEEKVLGPSAGQRLMALLLLCFIGFFWLIILGLVLEFRSPFGVVLVAFLFLSYLIFHVLRTYFFSTEFNYRLTFSAAGIAIDDIRYPWAEIAGTYIMDKHEGKTTNIYLILVKKDGSVCKNNLFLFTISGRQLGAIVEHYKSLANHH